MKNIKVIISKILHSPNIIVCFVGIFFILVSVIIGTGNTISIIFISIGTSILASGVISFINYFSKIREENYKHMLRYWGLSEIYKTRAEMNSESNKELKKAKTLEICAMGLKGYRDAQTPLIKSRVSKGLNIKILTLSPDSKYALEIDKTEGILEGSTKDSIKELIKWIDEIKKEQKYDGQIELRTYDHYPYDFYFSIDGNLYIGPYQNKTSQQTITYRFKKDSEGYKYYKNYFDILWQNSKKENTEKSEV